MIRTQAPVASLIALLLTLPVSAAPDSIQFCLDRGMQRENSLVHCTRALTSQDLDRWSRYHLLLRRGSLYLLKGEQVLALADFDQAHTVIPDDKDALAAKAVVYYEREDFKRFSEADAQADGSSLPEDSEVLLIAAGLNYYHKGILRWADESYSKVIALNPDWYLPYLLRAKLRSRYNLDGQDALPDFERARALNPDYLPVIREQGLYYLSTRQIETGIRHFDAYLAEVPRDVITLGFRAQAWVMLKHFDQALADYSDALAIAPADADLYILRAEAYSADHRHRDAAADYGRALALRPDDLKILTSRAEAFQAAGAFSEALSDAQHLIQLQTAAAEKSYDSRAYYMAGDALIGLKRYDEAIAAYSQDIEVLQTYPQAAWLLDSGYISRAYAQALKGDDLATEADIARARGRKGQTPGDLGPILEREGWIRFLQGKPAAARAAFAGITAPIESELEAETIQDVALWIELQLPSLLAPFPGIEAIPALEAIQADLHLAVRADRQALLRVYEAMPKLLSDWQAQH